MPNDVRYWFPAKRYGWGWGLPITWQGWAIFAGFLVLVVVGAATLARQSPVGFIAYILVLCACLTAVCWWKGEPPRWRWGGE
ncbi:hypothetical protein AS156_09800 [Bradyrhizobium macuxiense]|uniref:Uncharacterized protein n=1 Tax=Bradyrhizobium macuxiense TaxID=1755647 RepID=A0A109JQ44_9BRAD|nr:hypothetical protein [Bradyrhizobium macuxiense]KWV52918.1 hypothetical protein AS156_09800 [Bradyrhizobium macuxiense]